MTLQEKYNWATIYALEFGLGFILTGAFVFVDKPETTIIPVIGMAVAYSLIGIVHAFRIVYLKGRNSA